MGSQYTVQVIPDDYDETKHAVRFTCLAITLLSNIFLFGFMIFKVMIKNEKRLNIIIGCAMFYISCTIFAALYNLLYRFTTSIDGCESSDIFEELTLSFTRSILLLFYVIMITKVFANSKQAINNKLRVGLIAVIIIVHMILLPSIYIAAQKYFAIQTPNYGVYCRNELNKPGSIAAVILYHILDFAITVILCILFLYKLRELLQDLRGPEPEQNEDKNEVIQQRNAKEKLLRLVKKAMILTLISVISSWIIIFGGRIDSESKTFVRWIYPLDYVFNGWCVFLFFDWREFQCFCLKNKEVELEDGVGSGTVKTEEETETVNTGIQQTEIQTNE